MAKSRPARESFEGNWACSKCNAAITTLPFNPENTENLTCRDCYMKEKAERRAGKMIQGNWKCMHCGSDINELPFNPRDPESVSCRDCFQNNR
ncbi:hypothetical protein KC901_01495 [Patescibacteria group bacterium]|nr:hypothetical protein [Patescibacteria group bacterium]